MAEGADPIAIAKAAGFTIQQQDLDSAASELSDADLEGVAGGGGRMCWEAGDGGGALAGTIIFIK